MATVYSNNYAYSSDGRSSINILSNNNKQRGEATWYRAIVDFPAGTVSGDIGIVAPMVSGLRPNSLTIASPTANSGLTLDIGYTTAPTAIAAAFTGAAAANTGLALTIAQINAITVLSPRNDNLIITANGSVPATAFSVIVLIEMCNYGF